MRENFSKFEKTAGIFVALSFVGFAVFTIFIALKQGWFDAQTSYRTKLVQGEGLHAGTAVQMLGLRAGTISGVKITEDNQIEVTLTVKSDFAKKIRKDSIARVIRPFIIGDKALEITAGSTSEKFTSSGEWIASEETIDLMDLLGGGHLGPYLKTLDSLLKNLEFIAQAFSDPKRSEALIGIFDQTLPTLTNLNEMAEQMTRRKNLAKTLQQTANLLPQVAEFSKNLPSMGADGVKVMAELKKTTEELNKILPILAQVAPRIPEVSEKSVEAVREAVVVLKAMQRSFLLRSSVKEVKEEEEKQRLEEKSKIACQSIIYSNGKMLEKLFLKRYLLTTTSSSVVKTLAWISMTGISLGVLTMIVVLSVMNGFDEAIEKRLLQSQPHLVVTGLDSTMQAKLKYEIPQSTMSFFSRQDVIVRTVDGLFSGAVAYGSDGQRLNHIGKKVGRSVEIIEDSKGSFVSGKAQASVDKISLTKDEIAMGVDLARSLGIFEGDDVTIISPESLLVPGEAPTYEKVKVRALMRSEVSEYDSKYIYFIQNVGLRKLRDTASIESGFEIMLPDPNFAPRVKELLSGKGITGIKTWEDLNGSLFIP